MPSRWRRRAEWLWAPALYVFVVLLLYREVWLGLADGKHWFGWDCLEMHWPDLSYLAGAFRHGEWPLWNPYDRGGYPFYSDTQTGLYYPLTWLFAGASALFGGLPGWVAQAHVLAMLAIAGISMHAYLRSRGLHPAAAAFGGVAWIVSAPMIIHKAAPVIWAQVWGPLVWLAVDRLVERARSPGSWRRAVALGGLLYLSGSAGPPQGFFYVLLTSAAYGLLRVTRAIVDARRGGRLGREAWLQARGIALAAAVAVALLAIIELPARQVLAFSPRAVRALSYNLSNPLPVGATLRGLISPPLGILPAYGGVLVLALLVTALVTRPRADRGTPILLAGLAAFAFVLSFGASTPVLPWLAGHTPGFGLFREANRYKLMAAPLLAATAAFGFDAILQADPARRRRALVVALASVAALLVVWAILRGTVTPAAPRRGEPTPGTSATPLFLGIAAVLLVGLWFAGARVRLAFAGGLIVLAYVDVAAFAQGAVRVSERPVDDQEDRRFLDGLGDVEREWRIFDEYVMEQRPGSRLRVRDLRGYPSGDPFELVRYRDVLRELGRTPELLEAFNVRWVLHGPHHRNQKGENYLKQPPTRLSPKHFRALDGKRFEALHPVPVVAWYGSLRLLASPKEALAELPRLESDDGQRFAAVVERADVPRALLGAVEAVAAAPPTRPLVAGRITSFTADEVGAELEAPAAGIVVLNEVYFPGWRLTIDGRTAQPFRVNYLLRGALVGPGHHTLSWEFAPPSYPWLAVLWLGGLAAVMAAAITALWRRGSRRAPDPGHAA